VLWRSVGFTENDALQTNILSGALSILSCFVAVGLIDRIGRKPLLWIGSAGMAVTLGLVTFAFASASLDASGKLALSGTMGVVALVAANFYVIFFNISWGPVMWVMLGEMFPNQIRGSALAVSGFFQWFANFVITFTFPIMAAGLGLPISYTFYAVCAVISFFLVAWLVHETRGKELEQMEG
jgi:MFS transporter, SP family, sugar:H+ symporter